MPIAPFYRDSLTGSQFKQNSFAAFWMNATVDGSGVVRNAELISIADAGQQICLVHLLGRVSILIWDYIQRKSGPRIDHCCILPGEQDSSHVGVRSRTLASIFRSLPDCRNVLGDIQLCPEINVVRPIAAEIDSRHSVVGLNPLIINNNYWSSDQGNLFIWADPRTLTLAHSISRNPIVYSTEYDETSGKSGIYDYSPKRPFRDFVFFCFLGCIFIPISFVLLDKAWRGVYLDVSMNAYIGFARLFLSGVSVLAAVLLFLAGFQLFP